MGAVQSIVNIVLILLLLAMAMAAAVLPMQIEYTRHALQERAEGITRADVFRQMPKANCEQFKVWVCQPSKQMNSIIAACKIEGKDLWIRAVLGFVFARRSPTPSLTLVTAYPSSTKSLERTLKRDNCSEANPDFAKQVLDEILQSMK